MNAVSTFANNHFIDHLAVNREEDVNYVSDHRVLFKVIIEENGGELNRYVELDLDKKSLKIIKQSNKQGEQIVSISQIASITRSMLDNRQV